MEKIYVDIHPVTGNVIGYGDMPISENSIEVSVDRFRDYSDFYQRFTSYTLNEDNELVFVSSAQLEEAKLGKTAVLRVSCEKEILGRFQVTLDGVDYWFSNDLEAQINFDKMDRAFEKGRVTQLPWTAYLADGNVTRVLVDAQKFELIYTAHLSHIQNNISKFRDHLMPRLMQAITSEQVDEIHWDMDLTP